MLDAGMVAHRDALLPGRLARARRRRDGHRLAQPEGLHRRQAGPRGRAARSPATPASATSAAEIEAGLGRAARRRLASRRSTSGTSSARTRSRFIDPDGGQADEGRRRRRQRHGRADGRPDPRASSASSSSEMYFEPDGEFPDHEPNPLLEENRRMIIERVRAERRRPRRSPGTATPTAASSSTTAASSATATSSAPCSPARRCAKNPGATILYDPRSSRAVPDTGRRRGRPLGPLAASATPSSRRGCARRARPSAARSPATTTSATSGAPTRGRSRRC